MAKSPNLSRNDFVKVIVGVLGTIIGAVVGLPAIGYILSPALKVLQAEAWVPLGLMQDFTIGAPVLVNFTRTKINGWERTVNSYGVFVLRKSDTEAEVFSNVCTHLSCRVNWNTDVQEYICPCHDGHFNIQGDVTAGPPPRPLVKYETKVEDGKLSIHFVEG
jgi:Rieske Fe-S protein